MKILSIETSCDETAIALVEAKGGLRKPHFKILKNLVASQIKIHQPFGGVVPNLAKREHERNLPVLLKKINLMTSDVINIDLIAVTAGPGLEPCLWTGINFAKDLAKKLDKPLAGANHLEGHLYSFLLPQKTKISNFQFPISKNIFPAIALIVSGGHTILLLMKDFIHFKKLGETRDDAAGEAFDKVARPLNLPYPGGPNLEKLAKSGNPNSIDFPRPMLDQKNYDFSFSGLKTSVLYYLREAKNLSEAITTGEGHKIPERAALRARPRDERSKGGEQRASEENFDVRRIMSEERFLADVAASFQQAVIDVLTAKTFRAAREFNAKSILLSGGVAANNSLRNYLKLKIKNQKSKIIFLPTPKKFCGDNAAMTAVAAYFDYLKKEKHRPRRRTSSLRGKLIARGDLNL